MELTPEILTAAIAGIGILFTAWFKYFSTKSTPPAMDVAPVSVVDRDHAERTVRALERIAAAVETATDKRQSDMQHTLEEIAKNLKGIPK
jgi:hypothetical protein